MSGCRRARIWIRRRCSAMMAPSPEEQRLADIYAKKGLAALITELNRY